MNDDKINFLEILRSVFASMIGIQSDKNRERDFKKGAAWTYIAVGIVVTLLFVVLLYSIVSAIVNP